MPLQEWIHHFEVGAGARILRITAAVLGFCALACLYDVLDWQSFSSEEAMETAQLARNIADGKGFVTQSVRPLALSLLRQHSAAGAAADIFHQATPDVTTPPVYPYLLAAAMKVLPMRYNEAQEWSYQPEHWIAAFNQVIFVLALVILYRVARRLFDNRVGWLSVVLFGGTNLLWRFTVSGLSTCWVMLVFLALVWCLMRVEEFGREGKGVSAAALEYAILAGVVLAIGGLSRYSFAWLAIPSLIFVAAVAQAARTRLCLGLAAGFIILMLPWVVRNEVLTGMPFGTATMSVFEGTGPFPDDILERSFNPEAGMRRISPRELVNKVLAKGHQIWHDELPRLGGNWIDAFFFAGLLIPFQAQSRARMRWFLLGALAVFCLAQATGETHIAGESPDVNTENLLVLVFPLVTVYGAAMFFILLDQWEWATPDIRALATGAFVALLCAPLLIALLLGRPVERISPYSPLQIRRVARLYSPEELLVSDIPSGVAWYGNRTCAWLPLDDDRDYYFLNSLKPVKAVYLTQRTSDERLLSQMLLDPKSWGYFFYQCVAKGVVPDNFPLTNAPSRGLLPYQILLSDSARWR